MPDLDHARLILTAARKDLKAQEGMTDGVTFEHEIFGFHAQQVVEKTLKAWLSICGVAYPRIHDLEELIGFLTEDGELVPDKFRTLTDLTDFAVQFRYEAFDETSGELNRSEIIAQLSELVNQVQSLLAIA